MSDSTRETNENSDCESSTSSSQSSKGAGGCLSESSKSSSSTSGSGGSSSSDSTSNTNSNSCSEENIHGEPTKINDASTINPGRYSHKLNSRNVSHNLTNGQNFQQTAVTHDHVQPSTSSKIINIETEESTLQEKNSSDEKIQRSQERTGQQCDSAASASRFDCIRSPKLEIDSKNVDLKVVGQSLDVVNQSPSASRCIGDSLSDISYALQPVTSLRPNSSASSSIIDTNNNKNMHSNSRIIFPSGLRRTNFSKSTSCSRSINRDNNRSRVCDCLAPNCEKEHSNRRQFIESYYNSRTRLPSANAMSSLTISTPLNRLSECDAITKRLLSSPIRTVNFLERPVRRTQIGEIDKSRRASLGTNTMAEQVSLFSPNQFTSLELGNVGNSKLGTDNHSVDYHQQNYSGKPNSSTGKSELRLKQQQERSLSVCQDDTLKTRFRNSSTNHSSNLNRAVSLACESGSSKRLLTIIPLFGCDMKALEQFMKLGLILPPPIDSAVDHILINGINAIGIFRKSGVKSRILTLKQRIETHQDASIEEINRDNEFSIYDIADLVKMWFRELNPMPIMTKDLIKIISTFSQTSRSLEDQSKNTSHQHLRGKFNAHSGTDASARDQLDESVGYLRRQLNSNLSPTQRALFSKAMKFLATISSNSEINQMTSQNLAICLTPSLCATESDQTSIMIAQKALKYCIDNYRILF